MTLAAIEHPARELQLAGERRTRYERIARDLGPRLAPIESALNAMIDGTRIQTAGWMPGSDWAGTPFQAIWEVCGQDHAEAAKAFGLIVWKVFEKRPETWASAKGMIDGKEIPSRTNFRWPNET
jgi:hypothetical protein